MNGEIKELYNEIDKRLSVHEALQDQWQENHAKNSADRYQKLTFEVGDVKNRLLLLQDKMKCSVHTEKLSYLCWGVNTLWGVLIIGSLLKAFFWLKGG